MPTTTKLQLPYPAATDPADVPLDLQKLASAVDSDTLWLYDGPKGSDTGVKNPAAAMTGGPSVTAPKAGTYAVLFGGYAQATVSGTFDVRYQLMKAGAAVDAVNAIAGITVANSVAFEGGNPISFFAVALTAGQALTLAVYSPSASKWERAFIIARRIA